MSVVSPLTGLANTTELSKLSVNKVVDKYKQQLDLDVSRFFDSLDFISVYQCEESKLKFYYPFNLTGDAAFYDDLSKNYKGYYANWKWEHSFAEQFLKKDDNVLEIGCGNGYFLQKIQGVVKSVIGLDFNPSSIEFGKKSGIPIFGESIETHKKSNEEKYDYIAAFQLFEHVNDVGGFLSDTLFTLKPGGKLIIGVPNNDSPIFKSDPYHTLNLPPHHMLLWDRESLSSLQKLFGLVLVDVKTQPVDSNFKSAAYKLLLHDFIGENWLSKVVHMSTRFLVKKFPFFKSGQTIVAIFEKK